MDPVRRQRQTVSGGPYLDGTTYTETVAAMARTMYPCLQFVINDSYGDGFVAGTAKAYTLYLDGKRWRQAATMASKTSFSSTVLLARRATTPCP